MPWAVSDVARQVVSLEHFGFPVLKRLKADGSILDWRLWPNTSQTVSACRTVKYLRTVPKSNNFNIRCQNASKSVCACPFTA